MTSSKKTCSKRKFNMSREEFERLTGRYHNIIERIKELTEEKEGRGH